MGIHTAIERGLVPLALAASAAALFEPAAFAWLRPHIPAMLGLIMFGMGATLRTRDFVRVSKRPGLLAAGAAAQYGLMPLLGWIIAAALGLPPDMAAGVVLLGACPGGTASNVIAYLARADVGLSVSLTLLSTLLAPLLTPWLTWLYARQSVEVDVASLMIQTVSIVLAPLAGGLAARLWLRERMRPALRWFPALSVGIIAAVIGCVTALNADRIAGMGTAAMAAVVLHNAGGLASGYLAGMLLTRDPAARRALSIEVGMQNSGLATALALGTPAFGAQAALPGAVFSLWHNLTGSALAAWWSRGKNNGGEL